MGIHRKGKVKIWMIGCLCIPAVLAGCGNSDKNVYKETTKALIKGTQIRQEAAQLCASAADDASSFFEARKYAVQNGEQVDQAKYCEQLSAYEEQAQELQAQTTELQEKLNAVKTPKTEEGRKVLEAADLYLEEIQKNLGYVQETAAFNRKQYEAGAPLDEISGQTVEDFDGDQAAYSEAWQEAALNTYVQFDAMETPDYLEDTWNAYNNEVMIFAYMTQYYIEGTNYGDIMKMYSAMQLLQRQDKALAKYENEVYDLYVEEYTHARENLEGALKDMEQDIQIACNSRGRQGLSEEQVPDAVLNYDMVQEIYPNLYHSMDSVINLSAYTSYGSRDVVIEAEIAGYSQAYVQKETLTSAVKRIAIKPPILTDMPELTSSRDTQIVFSVTDAKTGEILARESQTVKLHSTYDFKLVDDEFGTVRYDDFLAWLTPESEGVMQVRRQAISWLESRNSPLDSLPGYQNALGLSGEEIYYNTILQVVAIQAAISEMGVRYNMGAYSLDADQRILMPDQVLESKSGICIETAILMASVLQSADMHAMIVLTPGHAQVAVEAWSGACEYFLIETTLLPFEGATESELNQLITYYDQEQWQEKLGTAAAAGTAYVVDCDLIQLLDYRGIAQNGGSIVGWDNNTGTSSSNSAEDATESQPAENGMADSFRIGDGLEIYAAKAVAFLESPALSLDLPLLPGYDYEVVDDTSFDIYYTQAREYGYQGLLVTIKAYALDDHSYEDLPSYAVAGTGAARRYVAIFPTDLQIDPKQSDADQYQELLTWFEKIDENNPENPFKVLE